VLHLFDAADLAAFDLVYLDSGDRGRAVRTGSDFAAIGQLESRIFACRFI